MTTVEIHDTPAAAAATGAEAGSPSRSPTQTWDAAQAARQGVALVVTDVFGRRIGIGHVSAFDRMRLAGITTPEEARSRDFMLYAVLALSVRKIGDEPVFSFVTRREFDNLCQQLDTEGFDAIYEGWIKLNWLGARAQTQEQVDAAEAEDRRKTKNFSATPTSDADPG